MPYKDLAIRNEKHKEYRRRYYEKNKEVILAKSAMSKKKNRAEFAAFKATLSCTKCGENHPATLDFHHHTPHPSNKKINALTTLGAYDAAIKEIMTNCIVLCSNCHRKHHWEDRRKA